MMRHAEGSRGAHRAGDVRWARTTIIVLLGGLGLSIVWLVVSALITVASLSAARDAASAMQQHLGSGDVEALTRDANEFAGAATRAHVFSRDLIWQLAGTMPFIGENFRAITVTATAAHEVGEHGLPPLTSLTTLIDPKEFAPVNGVINTSPLIEAQPHTAEAAAAFTDATTLVNTVDDTALLPPLTEQIVAAQGALNDASAAVSSLNALAKLAPAMLGADGVRSTVLLFQNLAEARATGGIPGAFALVTTNQGSISLDAQASTSDFDVFEPPVMSLPVGTRSLFGSTPAQRIQDVNYTPDFALTGQLTQAMWQQKFGQQVDSVVSLDPLVLSYVLEATGPVTLPTGEELNAGNAVQLLLSDVYARYPNPADQDAFFAAVAALVFEQVASGNVDGQKLVAALVRAGAEHRVYVFNSNAAEQQLLAGTTLATLVPQQSAHTTGFGLYLNDQTGSKMDTFLQASVDPAVRACQVDGGPEFEFTLTLTNSAPAHAATSLPEYVTGGGWFGTASGNIRTQVLLYGPENSAWLPAQRDGNAIDAFTVIDAASMVQTVEVTLAPGESTKLKFTNVASAGAPSNIELLTSPLPSMKVNIAQTMTCSG